MKDFFELLVKKYGLPEFIASYAMLLVYIVLGCYGIFKFIKTIRQRIRKRAIKKIVDKDLHPYFTHNEIYKYTKYYIPQYFQNITPSEGEELGRIHAAAARSKLMPEFLDRGLLTDSPVKYFIILSDTGMGKTAFLINLYKKYKNRNAKIKQIKYNIHLFPLGSKDALAKINNVTDKTNTILLLDAFDEDIKAVQDYKLRMIEILDAVKDFRKVIFTCRTQFFPNKDEEPTDTNDITFGDNIRHKIQKLYLSSFDNKDVIKYLLKKYELNIYKLIRAYQLVKKCPSLMFRPMLLTYIDDLIVGRLFYEYSYEMYAALIDKWVEREAQKPAILARNFGSNYAKNLLIFSKTLSVDLYNEREKRQGYFITIEGLKKLVVNKFIDPRLLSLDDKTGRSLLNRNSIGQFKFAHKSILEYFLALEVFENPSFLQKFDFHGMDATQNFYNEMLTNMLNHLEGKYLVIGDTKTKPLSSITKNHITKLSRLIISDTANINFKNFAGFEALDMIVFADVSYSTFYILYLYICFIKNVNRYGVTSGEIKNFQSSIEGYANIIRDISKMVPSLDYEYVEILIEHSDIEKNLKSRLFSFINTAKKNKWTSLNELASLRDTVVNGRSEKALIIEAFDRMRGIYKLTKYLPDVNIVF